MQKEKTTTELMLGKGFTPLAFANSRGLNYEVFMRVLNGANIGKRADAIKTRACLEALFAAGCLPESHYWTQNREKILNKAAA